MHLFFVHKLSFDFRKRNVTSDKVHNARRDSRKRSNESPLSQTKRFPRCLEGRSAKLEVENASIRYYVCDCHELMTLCGISPSPT